MPRALTEKAAGEENRFQISYIGNNSPNQLSQPLRAYQYYYCYSRIFLFFNFHYYMFPFCGFLIVLLFWCSDYSFLRYFQHGFFIFVLFFLVQTCWEMLFLEPKVYRLHRLEVRHHTHYPPQTPYCRNTQGMLLFCLSYNLSYIQCSKIIQLLLLFLSSLLVLLL